MAIHHARPAEIIDIRPLGPQLPITGTSTLFKTQAVEAIRMVLPAGKEVPSHDLPREVILQCLEGCVEILVDDQRCTLEAGHMLYVAGDQRHGLHAKEDSSVLVTILLEHESQGLE